MRRFSGKGLVVSNKYTADNLYNEFWSGKLSGATFWRVIENTGKIKEFEERIGFKTPKPSPSVKRNTKLDKPQDIINKLAIPPQYPDQRVLLNISAMIHEGSSPIHVDDLEHLEIQNKDNFRFFFFSNQQKNNKKKGPNYNFIKSFNNNYHKKLNKNTNDRNKLIIKPKINFGDIIDEIYSEKELERLMYVLFLLSKGFFNLKTKLTKSWIYECKYGSLTSDTTIIQDNYLINWKRSAYKNFLKNNEYIRFVKDEDRDLLDEELITNGASYFADTNLFAECDDNDVNLLFNEEEEEGDSFENE